RAAEAEVARDVPRLSHDAEIWILRVERAVECSYRHKGLTRGCQIRFRVRVIPGGATRAVHRNHIVATPDGGVDVDCTNCDRRGRVAGRGDAAVPRQPRTLVLAIVAGCDEHDDSC